MDFLIRWFCCRDSCPDYGNQFRSPRCPTRFCVVSSIGTGPGIAIRPGSMAVAGRLEITPCISTLCGRCQPIFLRKTLLHRSPDPRTCGIGGFFGSLIIRRREDRRSSPCLVDLPEFLDPSRPPKPNNIWLKRSGKWKPYVGGMIIY